MPDSVDRLFPVHSRAQDLVGVFIHLILKINFSLLQSSSFLYHITLDFLFLSSEDNQTGGKVSKYMRQYLWVFCAAQK